VLSSNVLYTFLVFTRCSVSRGLNVQAKFEIETSYSKRNIWKTLKFITANESQFIGITTQKFFLSIVQSLTQSFLKNFIQKPILQTNYTN